MSRETLWPSWNHICDTQISNQYLNTIQNIFVLIIQKYKKMKYVKTFWHTYVTISGSWWKWHVWISSEVDPLIGIVIQSDDLSPPPVEKVLIVGCRHPTSSLPPHHLGPPCHGWIVRSSRENLNSRSQAWNPLKKEAAQDGGKPVIPFTPLFTLR
jgi:hypothetical protein